MQLLLTSTCPGVRHYGRIILCLDARCRSFVLLREQMAKLDRKEYEGDFLVISQSEVVDEMGKWDGSSATMSVAGGRTKSSM